MFEFNGQVFYLPGSYGVLEVISEAGAAIPDFQVGLIAARSLKGRPYNTPNKDAGVLMPMYDNDGDILRDYGDDNILQLYKYAARKGAKVVFVVNLSPNTKVEFELKNGEDSLITLTAKDHWAGITGNDIKREVSESASTQQAGLTGAMSGNITSATATTFSNTEAGWTIDAMIGKWVRITGGKGAGQIRKISDNTATEGTVSAWTTTPDATSTYQIVEALWTLSFIPPRNVKRLVENSGTADYCYVNSINGLSAGNDVYLQSNTYAAPVKKIVQAIDTVRNTTKGGFRITFTTAIAATATLAAYGRIFQPATDATEVIIWTGDYSLQKVVDEINGSSKYFVAEIVEGASALPATAAADYVQNVTTNLGTNPYDAALPIQECAALADYTNFASSFKELAKQFLFTNKVKIRNIVFDSYQSTVHAVMRDLAIQMRSAGSPISVVAGCAWGDVDETASGDTNPAIRAKTMNSDDFTLAMIGLDRYPSCLSMASEVFGIKVSNATNHNMTRDEVVCSSIEKDLSESQQIYFIKNGVLFPAKFKNGIKIVRGINTYQYQSNPWNAQDHKTYLIMCRDLADKFFRGLIEGLDEDLVGLDGLTREGVQQYCFVTGTTFKNNKEISDFKILSVKKGKAGWLPSVQIEVPEPVDFFGTKVFVIQPSYE